MAATAAEEGTAGDNDDDSGGERRRRKLQRAAGPAGGSNGGGGDGRRHRSPQGCGLGGSDLVSRAEPRQKAKSVDPGVAHRRYSRVSVFPSIFVS